MPLISHNPSYAPLHRQIVSLAFAADKLAGKGNIVDAASTVVADIPSAKVSSVPEALESLRQFQDLVQAQLDRDPTSAELHDLLATAKSFSTYFCADKEPSADYLPTLSALYGYPIGPVPEDQILAVRDQIATELHRLGFAGDWPECLTAWKKSGEISFDQYLQILTDFCAQFENYAFDQIIPAIIGDDDSRLLRQKSEVKIIAAPEGVAWNAYHYYLGNFKSRIEIASKAAFCRYDTAFFVAHEIFPGHHTQAIILDWLLSHGKIGALYGLVLLHTPCLLLAEGLADFGQQLLGLTDSNYHVAYLEKRLSKMARHNAAIKFMQGRIDLEQAQIEYARLSGCDATEAARGLRYAQNGPYYFPTYVAGENLVDAVYGQCGLDGYRAVYPSYSLEGLMARLGKKDIF